MVEDQIRLKEAHAPDPTAPTRYFKGFASVYYGRKRIDASRYGCTRWLTFIMFLLYPLHSAVVTQLGVGSPKKVGIVSLDLSQVGMTYLVSITYLLYVVFAFIFLDSFSSDHGIIVTTSLGVGIILWPIFASQLWIRKVRSV